MNIYLISQSIHNDWDTYDSAVVVAENESEARLIHPDKDKRGQWIKSAPKQPDQWGYWRGDWPHPDHVTVKLIGQAIGYDKPMVICASFNAG